MSRLSQESHRLQPWEYVKDAIWCAPVCYTTDGMSAKVDILDELIYFIGPDK